MKRDLDRTFAFVWTEVQFNACGKLGGQLVFYLLELKGLRARFFVLRFLFLLHKPNQFLYLSYGKAFLQYLLMKKQLPFHLRHIDQCTRMSHTDLIVADRRLNTRRKPK